uniref:Rhodanese domain-containing protein n=1 Tax=Marinobacter nauticus TaxID=2743 RepID=A0A455W0K0_MARNT|nr:hypothetical protein YBY_02380 [Marinobacter nauticus]
MKIGKLRRTAALVSLKRIALWLSFLAVLPTANADGRGPDLALIEPQELAETIDRWILLDARPNAEWKNGHLPGAHSFSWEDYTVTDEHGIQYRPLPDQELAYALGRLGITTDSPVVVYGDAQTSWGGEGWTTWLLAWLGHQGPIRLLDGGIDAWKAAGLTLSETPSPVAQRQTVIPYAISHRSELLAETRFVEGVDNHANLVDVRSSFEWLTGRIAGATRISWEDFHSGSFRVAKTKDDLRQMLTNQGIDLDKPVVFYCAGGIRSAYAWTIAQLAGVTNSRNYEGSMEAWEKREN